MRRSENHILVSHAGALPRPEELDASLAAPPENEARLGSVLRAAVQDVVRHQAAVGVDIANDGEVARRGGFSRYMRDRLGGVVQRPWAGDETPPPDRAITGRDRRQFPGFYRAGHGRPLHPSQPADPIFAVEDLKYVGAGGVAADAERLKAAAEGLGVEPFLAAVAPGTMEHWLIDRHYPDEESFLLAIADALHEEYRTITDAGLLLQIDDPGLADSWQMFPDWTVPQYLKFAELRVEALNHALRGIPTEQVRIHVCWGSRHGPHTNDIPLKDLIGIAPRVVHPEICWAKLASLSEGATLASDRLWRSEEIPCSVKR